MSFISIALKNIRKKFGDYVINFISTVFAVTIFNLFCSMYYNPTFQKYRFGAGKMSVLFKGVAIAVLLFAAVFVMYSNAYFIKTRKKEIAIYSLLGMRKENIAILMFIETFTIGILATICGTLAGTYSAKYFTSILMKFMGAGTEVEFAVAPQAIVVTLLGFTLLFVINGKKAYNTIYKYQLIDLLSASKQGETMTKGSLIGALVSLVFIALAYTISQIMDVNSGGMKLLFPSFSIIVLISVGTYLLFCNMVPIMIRILKRKKSRYYKITNIISISQVSFRIKVNAKMLSIASILCAITVTMISASYSLYHGLEDSVEFYAPYSYVVKGITEEEHKELIDATARIGEVSITQDDKIFLLNGKMQDTAYTPDHELYPQVDESAAYIMSESQYLQIMDHTGTKKGKASNLTTDFEGNLGPKECYFIDCCPVPDYCENMKGSTMTLGLNDSSQNYQVVGASSHKYLGLIEAYKKATVVVSDAEYQRYAKGADEKSFNVYYGFMFDNEMESLNTVEQYKLILQTHYGEKELPKSISYIKYYKSSFAIYGAYVFIGIFIGILFLLAVGSMMYYKLIIEAQEEKTRFSILQKTGMKQNEIRTSIFKQLGITYLVPLGVGLVHTVFALLTYNRTMDTLGQETPTLLNAAIVVCIYVGMYAMFYLLSVWNYHKIVTTKE